MQRAIADMTFGLQYLAWLMAVCGGIAFALAVVGIYSMMAYAVSQRTHEFEDVAERWSGLRSGAEEWGAIVGGRAVLR